jgi:hypothetical protein
MKENARTIIRLIPFFDALLKISPLDIGPRVVYSNGNLLVAYQEDLGGGAKFPTMQVQPWQLIDTSAPRNSDEHATENNKTELNSALSVLVRHFESY